MAFGANVNWDVRSGGSDTACGGGFDPGGTAGMATDGAATLANTSAPVFTSASVTSVAGDVGAWLYVSSGTTGATCVPGWYLITAQSGAGWVLDGTAGNGYLSVNKDPVGVTTAVGIANGANPTAITFAIDYSQQNAATVTGTVSSVTTTVTATTNIFTKGMVGNIITDGTTYKEITAYTSATVVTVDSAPSWTAATIYVGGVLATPGKAGGLKVAGNDIFWQANGTTPYNLSTGSSNVAGGIVSDTTGGVDQTNPTFWVGWNTTRHLYNSDTTWPIISANLQTAVTLLSFTANYTRVRNVVVDGNSKATLTGFNQNASYSKVDHIKAQNCTVIGIDIQGGNEVTLTHCSATTCSGTAAIRVCQGGSPGMVAFACEAYANTTHGLQSANGAVFIDCISSANSGGSSQGFNCSSVGYAAFNCTSYGNGADGYSCDNSIGNILLVN